MEVENVEFLFLKEDNSDLLYDFVFLVIRVIVENVLVFVCFRDVVVFYILYEFF